VHCPHCKNKTSSNGTYLQSVEKNIFCSFLSNHLGTVESPAEIKANSRRLIHNLIILLPTFQWLLSTFIPLPLEVQLALEINSELFEPLFSILGTIHVGFLK